MMARKSAAKGTTPRDEADRARLWIADCETDRAIMQAGESDDAWDRAVEYWLGLPQMLDDMRNHYQESLRSGVNQALYLAHHSAVAYLAGVADSHGISRRWILDAGTLCSGLYFSNAGFAAAWNPNDAGASIYWPGCLGHAYHKLPGFSQKIVDEGDRAIRELAEKLEIKDTSGQTPAILPSEPEIVGKSSQDMVATANSDQKLHLVPGGFSIRGKVFGLTGRKRQLLESLLDSRWRRLTVHELVDKMELSTVAIDHPEQAVKDAAQDLRDELRKASRVIGEACENPLPSTGKGEDLCYCLEIS